MRSSGGHDRNRGPLDRDLDGARQRLAIETSSRRQKVDGEPSVFWLCADQARDKIILTAFNSLGFPTLCKSS